VVALPPVAPAVTSTVAGAVRLAPSGLRKNFSLAAPYWASGAERPGDTGGRASRRRSPDSHTAAAVSLAATSSGAFAHFETHELIEASDLAGIAERARGITYQPPGV
jgi:hypothetical protein